MILVDCQHLHRIFEELVLGSKMTCTYTIVEKYVDEVISVVNKNKCLLSSAIQIQ